MMSDMSDELRPDPLSISATESVCPETAAAWLYYCDQHDTHGNADTKAEADHMRAAHIAYFLEADRRAAVQSGYDDHEPDPCQVLVWLRTPHERREAASS
jgi:hypothetical protein